MERPLRRLSLAGAELTLALRRHWNRAFIAVYHRVSPETDPIYPPVPPDLFEEHLDHFQRLFCLVPLSELVERHRAGKRLNGLCALTFDDGYRDFLDHAYPVLRRRGIPVTHFLIWDSLASQQPTWNWRLNRITFLRDGNGCDMILTHRLGRLPAGQREAYLLAEEGRLAALPPAPALLQAQDLAQFDPGLVEWGSHSLTHSNLPWCDPRTARRELSESRGRLAELTGRPVRFFSYPNGACSEEVVRLAGETGYEAALAVGQRPVALHHPLHALPRFDLGAGATAKILWELSGALPSLRRLRAYLRGPTA
jgi:peptidoglycan/xylan/chitin deacetylase (PgdA/CDA1 family)